jgi:hypothetical protein
VTAAEGRLDEDRSARAWTIGTANRTEAEFLALLASERIETLADVRADPDSSCPPGFLVPTRIPRAHPDSSCLLHFRARALRAAVAAAGIAYESFGEELGGFREGGYEAHARTTLFAAGVDRLATLAREKRTAFCCAERDPRRCHRRFVAQSLASRGIEVVHLLGPGLALSQGERRASSQGRLRFD